jgi:methenyltetrahydromethanopterin cyclohydrolase
MLAQQVKEAGFSPLIIDCFADADSQRLALETIKVESLALKHLTAALSILKKTDSVIHVIYGSGFESHSKSLEYLHENYTVLGNTASVFNAIQDKVSFFSTLNDLNIPYPKSSFQLPKINPQIDRDWLIKPICSEGGLGIRKFNKKCHVPDSYYWQEVVEGVAMSVLFVADSSEFVIHGFHQQYSLCIGDNEYVFSAIISLVDVDDGITQTVSIWLEKLVSRFSLKGVNSLDFIYTEDQCYVLEINARPSASMQLYNNHLIIEHIKCFIAGTRIERSEKIKDCRGYCLIFAESECKINEHVIWPKWAADIPQAGSIINTGMPICSIIAGGENEQFVENELLSKQQFIHKLLNR